MSADNLLGCIVREGKEKSHRFFRLDREISLLIQQDQRQVQTQRIDPKLIMANTILQQTALELVQHIENELLENPALDVVEEEAPCNGNCLDPRACPYCSQRLAMRDTFDNNSMDIEPDLVHDIPYDLDEDFDPAGNLESEITLQDHLRQQLRGMVTPEDYEIGEYIISTLDESGYFDGDLDELALELDIASDELLRVLKLV